MAHSAVRTRVGVAIATGVAFGLLFFAVTLRHPQLFALDFTFEWRAARALVEGKNPYDVVRPSGPYPFAFGYYYPLPGALLAVPVAWMPAQVAGAVAVGLSSLVFALAILRGSTDRWPLLLSAPMVSAAATGQFKPQLIAAAFVWPAIQVLDVMKPNIGAAVFLAKPNKWAVIGGVSLLGLSLLLFPRWPMQWIAVVRADPAAHLAPILLPGGVLLLLSVFRWREPEGRLLLAFACIPHSMTWYDPLAVTLVARTVRESLLLALMSQLGFVASLYYERALPPDMPRVFAVNAQIALWTMYIPALVMVLRRPRADTTRRKRDDT